LRQRNLSIVVEDEGAKKASGKLMEGLAHSSNMPNSTLLDTSNLDLKKGYKIQQTSSQLAEVSLPY
jgi:hypothetical protein